MAYHTKPIFNGSFKKKKKKVDTKPNQASLMQKPKAPADQKQRKKNSHSERERRVGV